MKAKLDKSGSKGSVSKAPAAQAGGPEVDTQRPYLKQHQDKAREVETGGILELASQPASLDQQAPVSMRDPSLVKKVEMPER